MEASALMMKRAPALGVLGCACNDFHGLEIIPGLGLMVGTGYRIWMLALTAYELLIICRIKKKTQRTLFKQTSLRGGQQGVTFMVDLVIACMLLANLQNGYKGG